VTKSNKIEFERKTLVSASPSLWGIYYLVFANI